MNVNLREELEKSRKISIDESNKIVDTSKLLLATNEKEERNVLAHLGLDKNLKQVEKVRGINLERERFETSFEAKVFNISEIKELACEYGLRFLPSTKFKWTPEKKEIREVSRFARINDLDILTAEKGRSKDAENFMMLAPDSEFNLDDREAPERPIPPNRDPALFYKVAEGQYALVHQWGNDFSIMRLANSWRKRNMTNKIIHRQILFTGLSAVILSLFGVVGGFALVSLGLLMGSVFNLIFTSAQHSYMDSRSGRDTDTNGNVGNFSFYTEDLWDQPYSN